MPVMTPDELEAALRGIGAERYHNRHPFHRLLHGGHGFVGPAEILQGVDQADPWKGAVDPLAEFLDAPAK